MKNFNGKLHGHSSKQVLQIISYLDALDNSKEKSMTTSVTKDSGLRSNMTYLNIEGVRFDRTTGSLKWIY